MNEKGQKGKLNIECQGLKGKTSNASHSIKKMKVFLCLIVVAFLFAAVEANKGGRKDFCESEDPGEVLEKMDDCIKTPNVLETWLECREETVGSEDSDDAAEVYCAKDDKEKKEIRKQYKICLKESKVSWGIIKNEIENNCGICSRKHRNVLVKLDKCMDDGDVKDASLTCREEVLETRDPQEAVKKYCSADRKMRRNMKIQTLVCLKREGATKETWKAATKICKKERKARF